MSKAEKVDLHKLPRNEHLVLKKPQLEGINKLENPADNDRREPSDDEFMAKIGFFYMICSPVLI